MLRAKHFENAACGTVHAFQGDEKDVVIFSLALTDQTRPRTYDWLKTNKELINVATSRAREQLVILSNQAALDRLHADSTDDDIYELVQYVRKNGQSEVTEKPAASRALGIKPYSTKTEDAFLENLNHALDNTFLDGSRCTVRKEVPIAQVFEDNPAAPTCSTPGGSTSSSTSGRPPPDADFIHRTGWPRATADRPRRPTP